MIGRPVSAPRAFRAILPAHPRLIIRAGDFEDTMLSAKPAALPEPRSLIGSWRRFGAVGPVYEIVGLGTPRPQEALRMWVRVLETGEEFDYPLADILDDPRER
ncbi:hypothetical protein [Methylorubrum aminovorans]